MAFGPGGLSGIGGDLIRKRTQIRSSGGARKAKVSDISKNLTQRASLVGGEAPVPSEAGGVPKS